LSLLELDKVTGLRLGVSIEGLAALLVCMRNRGPKKVGRR
jgi:hypothetical protein